MSGTLGTPYTQSLNKRTNVHPLLSPGFLLLWPQHTRRWVLAWESFLTTFTKNGGQGCNLAGAAHTSSGGPTQMPPLLSSPRGAAQAASKTHSAGPQAHQGPCQTPHPPATCGPADTHTDRDLQDWPSSLRPRPVLLGACLPGLLIAGKKSLLRV